MKSYSASHDVTFHGTGFDQDHYDSQAVIQLEIECAAKLRKLL